MAKEKLSDIAKKSQENGENFVWNLYQKFNNAIDKVLCQITGETEETKFGLKDIPAWFKKKFNRKDNN